MAMRLSRGAVFVLCRSCDSIGMSCVCSRPSCVPFGMSCVCSRPSCVPFGMSCVCSRPSCVPFEMSCVRSRLLFAACAPNRTACVMFRSYSAVGRDRHSCVLESSVRLSGFMSSLLACAFSCGDPDGGRRRRGNAGTENGVGGEAECVFAQAYWLCYVFRGEYAGAKCGSRTAAAPQTAPKSLRLSGLSSLDSRQSTSCQTSQ